MITFGNARCTKVTSAARSSARGPPVLTLPDADGDGFADIAAAGDFLSVDLGAGDGFDRARATYGSGYVPKSLLAADLDADGHDDLIVRSVDDAALRVLMSVCQ